MEAEAEADAVGAAWKSTAPTFLIRGQVGQKKTLKAEDSTIDELNERKLHLVDILCRARTLRFHFNNRWGENNLNAPIRIQDFDP